MVLPTRIQALGEVLINRENFGRELNGILGKLNEIYHSPFFLWGGGLQITNIYVNMLFKLYEYTMYV